VPNVVPQGTLQVWRLTSTGKEPVVEAESRDTIAQLVRMTHGLLHPAEAGMLLDEHEDNVDDAFTAWHRARSTQFTARGGGNDEAATGSSYRDVRIEGWGLSSSSFSYKKNAHYRET